MKGLKNSDHVAAVLLFSVLMLMFSPLFADCQEPMYGKAVVDGDYSEWNLNPDFFANMYHSWDKPTVLAKLYLRYDCADNKMYALVLTTNMDRTMETINPVESWIKIDDDFAVKGTDESFEWINQVGDYAVGWEASFDLAVGDYGIKAHSNVYWDDESQTAGTSHQNIDICTDCPVLGKIGDYVWHDVDKNGYQDDGLPSQVGIANITVRLMICDQQGNVVDEMSTATNADGWYIFDNLPAGCYFVDVDERDEDMPTDGAGRMWVQTTITSENKHDPHQVALAQGEVYLQADFGFAGLIDPDLGTIGDYTWWDEDDDNQQPGDLELPYIIVELYKSGVLKARAKTDRFGNYLFYNVPFGSDYVVVVDESGPSKPYLVESLRSTVPYGEIGELTKNGIFDGSIGLFKAAATEDAPYWEVYDWLFTGEPPYDNNHLVTITQEAPNYLDADFPYLENEPIVVNLLSFNAEFQADGIHVTWQTAQENSIAGYNLLRRENGAADYIRVNEALVKSQGAMQGATYELIDRIEHAGTYYYKVARVGLDGQTEESKPITIALSTEVFQSIYGATDFALHPNYPNPFNPETSIKFAIPTSEWVVLEIFDLRGARVRTLVNENLAKGRYERTWDGNNDFGEPVATGLYFYRLSAGTFVQTRKMTVMK
ncbi:T9SS C-terminal target domain-containing protein [candidate division KSB1 bacterium]|nr:T9SS type A sorting domain-containing protein [candidate division KSB1 bacterium]RQW06146.1 MAG: T9SS C-terminal target domain-containing protein [candidate division KSB1 bacterium]